MPRKAKVEKILVFGFRGEIQFAGTPEEVAAEDAQRRANGEYSLRAPVAELPLDRPFQQANWFARFDEAGYERLKLKVGKHYREYGRFGDFGDVMEVVHVGNTYVLTGIAPKAYHKPGVATDVVPILIDSDDRMFFVGIRRGKEPGKGKLAFVGGFNDIRGMRFDSSVQTICHEGVEEAGIDIYPAHTDGFTVPFPELADVLVKVLEKESAEQLYRIGIFYTGTEEENHTLGKKRVHITAAYLLPIRFQRKLTAEELLRELIPQDHIENTRVAVMEIRKDANLPEFGLSHHRLIFEKAIALLQKLNEAGKTQELYVAAKRRIEELEADLAAIRRMDDGF